MTALVVGIILLAFTVFSVLPAGLDWGREVLLVLKGGVPILAAFIGFVAVFIGIADIKDKLESRREEQEELAEDKESAGT
jgi:hypothetical protein